MADTYRNDKPRVIPATRDMLERFTVAELRDYAQSLGYLQPTPCENKCAWINWLLNHRATVCMTLGD